METALLEQTIDMQEGKKCPFCAEQIRIEAIKCRYCGEFLDRRRPVQPSKWYDSTVTLVVAVLFLGPLALPLLWRNPRHRISTKLVVTALVIGLTVAAFYLMIDMYRGVMEQVEALGLS